MVLKGIKLRIYPDKQQVEHITLNFGANRFVWNQMLDMIQQRYDNNPDSDFLSAYDLNYLLTQLKKEYIWLKLAESTALQVTDHDLIEAYKGFFKHIRKYPRFKSKKFPKQSYQCKFVKNNIEVVDDHFIKLPKLGYLRYCAGRKIVGKIKAVTIRKSSTNKYYAVLSLDCENQAIKRTNKKVGLDVGVSDLVITSDGQKYQTIRFDKLIEYKKHQWEKKLARRRLLAFKDIQKQKKLGLLEPKSLDQYRNYQKAKVMVAKYSEKVANQRKDYLHKITAELVNSYDTIVIEDIKTNELLKKHNLARAIANQSWRELRLMLEYKCAWYGKQLIVIDPYKTSQICSQCGYDDGKHELDVRDWSCPNCHVHHDRDINASKNILNKGLGQALVK